MLKVAPLRLGLLKHTGPSLYKRTFVSPIWRFRAGSHLNVNRVRTPLHFVKRSPLIPRRVLYSTDVTPKEPEKQPAVVVHPKPEDEGTYKDIWRLFLLVKSDWKLLMSALTLLTVSCGIGMCIPKVIGTVLDSLKDIQGKEFSELMIWDMSLKHFFYGLSGLLLLGCGANYVRVILLRILSENLVAKLRANVIKHIIHQDAQFFDTYKVGDLISRVGNDAFIVSRSITQKISDGVKAVFIGSAGVGMMLSISIPLSCSILILMGSPLLLSAKVFGKQIRDNSKKLQEVTANLTRVSEEQFNGIKTIQSFVAEQSEMHKFNGSIRKIFAVGKEAAFINAKFFTTASIIGDLSFLVVLSYGSWLVFQQQLSVGDLTAFMLYTEYTGNAIFNLSGFFSEIMQGAGAASRIFELTDLKPRINPTRGSKFIPAKGGEIEFKNVSFNYPTRPTVPIFRNLNFKIEQGSNVCIVGPSGKGKSTIAWLLLHYYNPSQGQILIDGQDISALSTKSLRRHIGIVQQEPILMSGTIRDNITYGLTYTPTKEEIRSVAKQCFCHNFITRFPDTYDTAIGPHGTLLSGGQKQRIAIARALIKKPTVLILDEATSALDVESEGAINYTFGQLMKSKSMTIVSIAHRLSTIRRSENVIVLGNDGSVVEQGKFKELFANPASELSKLLREKSSGNNAAPEIQPQEISQTIEEDPSFSGEATPASSVTGFKAETEAETINEVLKDISTEGKPLKIPQNE
ncbi:ATP-binding cassette permease MDL2 KNAG_0E02800 [Huiozyma naganishii CBS 8797]|uniref:ATP-dependent permease MDL2, mitochondrial n=1 Tax=Huiozyma naganishii (strain ATCC MYA-139 / BCRC 22969 / CBS 8797 / KCTC 17520 / NBRC 10181 / NCYC 3082 / Yp74L-3) TaxID=1071383 RepID=J7S6S4_HUIN7|nr:hypothetical protein KNAG_0E02800 [Kazachstania naganishii CBS 8797]CCK70539.1 hypothetical protein KNAG_0E02800 [Kazachstania naganishii CBS 8797]